MKISFVILNYNREKELLITIGKTRGLMLGRGDYEIIVVDNASTDQSVAAVSTTFPEVKLIQRTRNNGIAGWNDGFALASGEYMVVLDDDSNVVSGLDDAIAVLDANTCSCICNNTIPIYEPSGLPGINASIMNFGKRDWKYI